MAAGDFPTRYMGESYKNSCAYEPDVCQLWCTIQACKKYTKKVRKFATKQPKFEEKTGQNRPKFRVLYAKKYTGLYKKVRHRWLCLISVMLVRLVDTGAFVLPSCIFVSICSLVFANTLKPTLLQCPLCTVHLLAHNAIMRFFIKASYVTEELTPRHHPLQQKGTEKNN